MTELRRTARRSSFPNQSLVSGCVTAGLLSGVCFLALCLLLLIPAMAAGAASFGPASLSEEESNAVWADQEEADPGPQLAMLSTDEKGQKTLALTTSKRQAPKEPEVPALNRVGSTVLILMLLGLVFMRAFRARRI